MAIRRLGWAVVGPEDVYVSDRVRRVAEEAAARALRLAVHRRAIIHAIVETWPVDAGRRTAAEWAALQERLPPGVSRAEIRNRTRQVRTFKATHDGRLPTSLMELEQLPAISGQVLLAAADKQLVMLRRTGPRRAALRVQLPLNEEPATTSEWAWQTIEFALPDHLPACAGLCIPTLRVTDGRVRVDLPWRIPAPSAAKAGHTVAIGLDWGINSLLKGTVGKLADTSTGTRVVTDGRMLRFDATGVSAKLHRLRGNRERVATRRERYARLLDGPVDAKPDKQLTLLQAKERVLAAEHHRICDRLRRLDRALSLGGCPLGGRPSPSARGDGDLPGGLGHAGDSRTAQGQRPIVRAGPWHGGRGDPASGRQGRPCGGDRRRAGHLQVLPTVSCRACSQPRAGPKPAARLEMGRMPQLRTGWRSRSCCLGANRRSRLAFPSACTYRPKHRSLPRHDGRGGQRGPCPSPQVPFSCCPADGS